LDGSGRNLGGRRIFVHVFDEIYQVLVFVPTFNLLIGGAGTLVLLGDGTLDEPQFIVGTE